MKTSDDDFPSSCDRETYRGQRRREQRRRLEARMDWDEDGLEEGWDDADSEDQARDS